MSKLSIKISEDYLAGDDYESLSSWMKSSGSITPTTIDERFFDSDPQRDVLFRDSYFDGRVIRFGINKTLAYERLITEESEDESKDHENHGAAAAASAISAPSRRTNVSKSIKSTKALKLASEEIKHHKMEVDAMNSALNHLFSADSVRVVLVDILERKGGKFTLSDKNLEAETHSVVLYKNPVKDGKHDVVIIDPSSPVFSYHLTNADMSDRLSEHTKLSEIKAFCAASPEKQKIYVVPRDKITGEGSHDFRDCVDIAVKIAFGLSGSDIFSIYDKLTLAGALRKFDIIKSSEKEDVVSATPDASEPDYTNLCHILGPAIFGALVGAAIAYGEKGHTDSIFDTKFIDYAALGGIFGGVFGSTCSRRMIEEKELEETGIYYSFNSFGDVLKCPVIHAIQRGGGFIVDLLIV